MQQITNEVEAILEPSDQLVEDLAALDGDVVILGVGGKIGPSLARLAKKAIDKGRSSKKVIGVSRFSEPGLKEQLEQQGIITHKADLLQEDQLKTLPKAQNVLYLAGTKFGTTGKEAFTWVMNTYLPGRIAAHYTGARMVVYSTGNVYPFTPVISGGADEDVPPAPIGEYGQSCLGRERIFQYFASQYEMPLLIYRLNYANDLRYGVLVEIARSVQAGTPIDLTMGHANVIWQGDANEFALRSLLHCSQPARVLNITGPETVPIRWLAGEFGKLFQKTPVFEGVEQPEALLSNAAESFRLFGYPRISLKQMIALTAQWLEQDGVTINKPTHFQERAGRF